MDDMDIPEHDEGEPENLLHQPSRLPYQARIDR